jgi:hypothetical protein
MIFQNLEAVTIVRVGPDQNIADKSKSPANIAGL